MGWNIYTQSYKDKQGKSKITYRITSPEGQYFKNLPIKVNPKDFDKKRIQVKATIDNATIINEKLLQTTTLLNKGWGLYEAGNYTWEELIAYLGGAKPNMDVLAFCNTILKNETTDQMYSGIKDAYGAAKKVLGRDLNFKDFNEGTFNKIIMDWKSRLRSATVKTYKYHLGLIATAAYKKRLTEYNYIPLKKWQKKKEKLTVQGNPYVETATPEDFLNALDNCTNLMHIEGLGFWLLCFGLRGLYPTDLCSIHEHKYTLYFDENSTCFEHIRHKTGEPMYIMVSYPFNDLQQKLRGYLELTHGYKINVKTGKKYLNTPEYELSKSESEGWFFKEYKKHTWDTISKNAKKVGFKPLKTARKTFETVALTLSISAELRNRLLGHQVEGVKQYYQNWEHEELQKQIHAAHEQVLEHFKIDKLYPAYIEKANEILKEKGIPPKVFNNKWNCPAI